MREADALAFSAAVYYVGFHVVDITGEADGSGYHAIAEPGPDSAADAPRDPHYIEARNGRMRIRVDDARGTGKWEEVDRLGGLGLGGFHPEGTDFVAILDGLATDLPEPVVGTSLTVQGDLATTLRALTGLDIVKRGGESAIPSGSSVPIEIVVDEDRIQRLHLDGEAASQTLQDLQLDPKGQLSDALSAFDIYVEYPELR